MDMFPNRLQNHRLFAELVRATRRVVEHPALSSTAQNVRENIVRSSLIATVCFYINLSACLRYELERIRGRSKFFVELNGTFLHLLLELCDGELATNNMPDASSYEPHYGSMLRAARDISINTRPIESIVDGSISTIEGVLVPEAAEYLRFSYQCSLRQEDAFATIALRELTLAESFKVILANIPQTESYARFRGFVSSHIALDEKEHSGIVANALEHFQDVDALIETMIAFYDKRARMYDYCLSGPNPLF